MWLIVGIALWLVPVFAYRYARKHSPSHAFCITGMALGAIVSPPSLGTYLLCWMPFGWIAVPLVVFGIVGLAVQAMHGWPGFYLATIFGLRSSGEVVHGIQNVYVEALNGVIWAFLYGAIGYGLDAFYQHRAKSAPHEWVRDGSSKLYLKEVYPADLREAVPF